MHGGPHRRNRFPFTRVPALLSSIVPRPSISATDQAHGSFVTTVRNRASRTFADASQQTSAEKFQKNFRSVE
jgi:hypothetical protein